MGDAWQGTQRLGTRRIPIMLQEVIGNMCAVSVILNYARDRVKPERWTPEVLETFKDLVTRLQGLDTAWGEPACEHEWKQQFISDLEVLTKQQRRQVT